MCTAINVLAEDNYFGRNLDYEYEFGQQVVICPKNFPLKCNIDSHLGIIGMAKVENGYPLFFDGANEKGVSMAGLSFPDNCSYKEKEEGKNNIPSYDLIAAVLSSCENMEDVEKFIDNLNITDEPFSENLHPSPLHFIISYKDESITIEQTTGGLKVYDNPLGVLTNNPPFDMQLQNLRNYMSLTAEVPENRFSEALSLTPYSRGMGALGLPGDISSASRFVRAAFIKLNTQWLENEEEKVNQFFHILQSVYQQKGCAKAGDKWEITHYSSCINTDKGIYYYNTYRNSRIVGIDMHRVNLESKQLFVYDLENQGISIQN